MNVWGNSRQFLCNTFPRPAAKYHGLLNQGATCYLNSVLQVLFMTEDFREAVERPTSETPGPIDHHLKQLFGDLKRHTAYTFNITKTLGIERVDVERDAAEYFEKILRLTSPEASQIFGGLLTHKNICSQCRTEKDNDERFWHLPLALVDSFGKENYSVVDGIEEYFRPSVFSGENQMYCDKCDGKSDATNKCVIKNHPEVLMLLLKRFEFDYHYMTYVKINCTVDVPYTLQIPENQKYELYAAVDHFGDLRCGCYTATIKDDESWYRFNDDKVTLLDYQPFQVDNSEKSRSVYLLFYRRTNVPAADTQDIREVSTPGGFLTATSEKSEDAVKRAAEAGNDNGEAEDTVRVGSRGVGRSPEPCFDLEGQKKGVYSRERKPYNHQRCKEEGHDLSFLQDAQALKHRDGGKIMTADEWNMGGNAEAGKRETLSRETQLEEIVADQDNEVKETVKRVKEQKRGDNCQDVEKVGSVEKTRHGDSPQKARTEFHGDTIEGRSGSEQSRSCYVKITEEEFEGGIQRSSETTYRSLPIVGGSSQGYNIQNNDFCDLKLSVSPSPEPQKHWTKGVIKNESNSSVYPNARKMQKVSAAQEQIVGRKLTLKKRRHTKRIWWHFSSPLKQHRAERTKGKKTAGCFYSCKRQKNADKTSELDYLLIE